MNSKIYQQWGSLPLPKAKNKKSVINVKGTNAWLFKNYLGTMGFLLAGVSQNEKFPKFENLNIFYKKEKLVEQKGMPNLRLKNCLEIHLEPFCDSDLLIRILDSLSNEEPSGRFESSLLLDIIQRVLELVKRPPKPPSKQEVIGAWGELLLLHSFIKSSDSNNQQSRLIMGWEASPTNRSIIDFMFPFLGNGIAIEAKTSSLDRIHHFQGIPQVTIPEGFNNGIVASLVISENESIGKTCADLVSLIKKIFIGNESEIAKITGEFVKKLLSRGPATFDERYRFISNENTLRLIEMSEVPRPVLSPGVKDVEWTAELNNCIVIQDSTISDIFPGELSNFL